VQDVAVNGIMVITDLSGFTKLTEAQSKLGDAGTELLTSFVNAYFSLFIKLTEAYGGDCIKFAGDALLCFVSFNFIVIFPRLFDFSKKKTKRWPLYIRRRTSS
jgi:class 3 adenylate cyclase